MPIIESLIRLADLAKLCKVSAATVERWLREEKTPAPIRLNRAIRFRASDVDRWIRLGCPARRDFERLSEDMTQTASSREVKP